MFARVVRVLVFVGVAAVVMTGCSQSNVLPTAKPTPTVTFSGAKALEDFKVICTQSMNAANSSGLTQTTTNAKYGVYTLVLDRSYNASYSAAVQNPDASVALIYEADAFAPFSAGISLDTKGTTVTEVGNVFTVTEPIEGKPQQFFYTVQNGLIMAMAYTDGAGIMVTSNLVYRVDPKDLVILKQAISENKQ